MAQAEETTELLLRKIQEMDGQMNAYQQRMDGQISAYQQQVRTFEAAINANTAQVQQQRSTNQTEPNDKLKLRMPILSKTTDRDFYRFEAATKAVVAANNWDVKKTAMAVTASLRDEAMDLYMPIIKDPTAFTSMDEFWTRVRKQFVSPAHQQIARAEYERRKQGPKETIRAFHAHLHR